MARKIGETSASALAFGSRPERPRIARNPPGSHFDLQSVAYNIFVLYDFLEPKKGAPAPARDDAEWAAKELAAQDSLCIGMLEDARHAEAPGADRKEPPGVMETALKNPYLAYHEFAERDKPTVIQASRDLALARANLAYHVQALSTSRKYYYPGYSEMEGKLESRVSELRAELSARQEAVERAAARERGEK